MTIQTKHSFAMKHNHQSYLNNDKYNNLKSEMCKVQTIRTNCIQMYNSLILFVILWIFRSFSFFNIDTNRSVSKLQ